MAMMGGFNTRMESVHEEENHGAGWGAEWDQGEWGQSGFNQNGWQNVPAARDSDVQPGDSISNASFGNTDTDWEGAAPPPPTKDAHTHMLAASNAWDLGSAAGGQPTKSALKRKHQGVYADSALDMHSVLSAIAEQRQSNLNGLTEKLRELQSPQTAAHIVQKAGRRHGKHQREASWGGPWNQASEGGTSHSNRVAHESVKGDAWGGSWDNQQNVNGSNWAGMSEATSSKSKSKKRPRSDDQHPKAQMNGDVDNGDRPAAAGDTTWGNGGGWGETSVAPGGFGASGEWGANASGTAGGGAETGKSVAQASGLTESFGWGDTWANAESNAGRDTGKAKTPKSGLSGFFTRIFGRNKNKKEKNKRKETEKDPWGADVTVQETKSKGKQKEIDTGAWAWGVQETKSKDKRKGKEKQAETQEQGKKGKLQKKQKFAELEAITWASPNDYDDKDYEDEEGDAWGEWEDVDKKKDAWGADSGHVRSNSAPAFTSKASDVWSNPSRMKRSKTFAYATDGVLSDTHRSRSDGHGTDHRIVESKGDALVPARVALFSKERLARDRIFWFFDPKNDQRVFAVLEWIRYMQVQLATFGFSKFIESNERGALFTNVEYRSPSAPHEPAFDWLTFDKIQPTMDRILQEQLAYYDPASQVLVFVFLLSASKRSMAIWRRKLPLPENIRRTYGVQVTKLVASMNKQYPIHVDEAPGNTASNLNRSTSSMKKWMSWGR